MSKMPRFVTVTGWRYGRRTVKYPFSYRLELNNEWITEPIISTKSQAEKFNALIGKKASLFEIIMRFGDKFELIDEREKEFDR